jgi:hypothetical protein
LNEDGSASKNNRLVYSLGRAAAATRFTIGRVVLDGNADALRENEDVKEFYLGIAGDGRRSFRAVKHYCRHKRWL